MEINNTFSTASETFLRLDNAASAVTPDSFSLNTNTLIKEFSLAPTYGSVPMAPNVLTGRWPKIRINSASFADSSGNFATFGVITLTYVY